MTSSTSAVSSSGNGEKMDPYSFLEVCNQPNYFWQNQFSWPDQNTRWQLKLIHTAIRARTRERRMPCCACPKHGHKLGWLSKFFQLVNGARSIHHPRSREKGSLVGSSQTIEPGLVVQRMLAGERDAVGLDGTSKGCPPCVLVQGCGRLQNKSSGGGGPGNANLVVGQNNRQSRMVAGEEWNQAGSGDGWKAQTVQSQVPSVAVPKRRPDRVVV
jgi:hypothetical protein